MKTENERTASATAWLGGVRILHTSTIQGGTRHGRHGRSMIVLALLRTAVLVGGRVYSVGPQRVITLLYTYMYTFVHAYYEQRTADVTFFIFFHPPADG